MADFDKPDINDQYVTFDSSIRENQDALAVMFNGVQTSNIPVNSVQFQGGKFSLWDGAAWNDQPVSIAGGGTGATTAEGAINALGGAPSSRNINTASPLKGGGDLSSDLSLSIQDGTTSQKGAVQLNNTLSSTSTTQALTAAQGKVLNDKFDLPSITIWTGSTSLGVSSSDILSQSGFTVKQGRYSIRYTNDKGTYNGELYIRDISDISTNTIDTRERNLTGTSYLYGTVAIFNDNTTGVGLLDRFGIKFIRDTGAITSATVSQIDYIGS